MVLLNYYQIFLNNLNGFLVLFLRISSEISVVVNRLLCRYFYFRTCYIDSLQLLIICFHLFRSGLIVHQELFERQYLFEKALTVGIYLF